MNKKISKKQRSGEPNKGESIHWRTIIIVVLIICTLFSFYGYRLTSANNHRVHRRGRSRTARQYKVGFSDSPGRIRRMRPLPPGDS